MQVERPTTLGALRDSGYQPKSVKREMRDNLIRMLRSGEPLFPGMVGYEETVFPQIENGLLSLHDMLFLGLRGQGKTRMLRMLTRFLDPQIPVVEGSEINDDPLRPLSKFARDRVATQGDDTPVAWLSADKRYHEKLATPDVTIADLIGEIDLVKHAEGRHLSNEEILHFGIIPRSHRAIFCMNELPDLSPKIQVGLFNVLEERDVQIRGFPIRLELDVQIVFSANPEDYTNRGRIVTPLKDRIGTVVRTHYPLARETGVRIMDENAWLERDSGVTVRVPVFLKEIVEETSRLARTSPHVNQASGVSVRMSIANLENVVSNAERRGVKTGASTVVARVSDLGAAVAGSRGKLELMMSEEPDQEDRLVERLIGEAVKNVFDARLKPGAFKNVVEYFDGGETLELDDELPTKTAWERIQKVRDFPRQLGTIARDMAPDLAGDASPEVTEGLGVCVAEFVLEALHCHNRLNKRVRGGGTKWGK
jgi:magnesium chelatase subunit I